MSVVAVPGFRPDERGDFAGTLVAPDTLAEARDALGLKEYGAQSHFGAKADCVVVFDAVVTAGSAVVTSSTAAFTSADVGKVAAIPYAGADSSSNGIRETHESTILSVDSATQITLAANAVNSIVGSRTITDLVTEEGSRSVTSATASFTAGDLGKEIDIPGADYLTQGTGNNSLNARIKSVESSTEVTLTRKCQADQTGVTVTIPGAQLIYGTNDTAALQSAVTAASTNKRKLVLEAGRYLINGELTPGSNLVVQGEGEANSIINIVGSGEISAFRYDDEDNPMTNVEFSSFQIDCSGVRGNTYSSARKAFYMRPCVKLTIERMYCHRSSATTIGNDYLRDSLISKCRVFRGGSQAWEFSGGAGGSGIGVGTGFWTHEPCLISKNIVSECGNRGIFTESQSSNIYSQGYEIVNNLSFFNGEDGIGDRACDGTLIIGNVSSHNEGAGIGVDSGFVNNTFSTNTMIANNACVDNSAAVYVRWKDGPITIQNNRLVDGKASEGVVYIQPFSGGSGTELHIEKNKISCERESGSSGGQPVPNEGRGIYVNGNTVEVIVLDGNRVKNCGRNAGDFGGIFIKCDVTNRLRVINNDAYDTRDTKKQDEGLKIEGAIARLINHGNDFSGNRTSEYDLTNATITADFTDENPGPSS